MAEAVDMVKAMQVFNTICAWLDSVGWKYEKHEDELFIRTGVTGDDLPMDMLLFVETKAEIVQLISRLPFTMPEEKRFDGAVAVCVANYGLKDGSFDYDLNDGEIRFRLTTSYRASTLGEDLFAYMVGVSAGTVDRYNDRFFMLAKGMISIEQFIEQDQQ